MKVTSRIFVAIGCLVLSGLALLQAQDSTAYLADIPYVEREISDQTLEKYLDDPAYVYGDDLKTNRGLMNRIKMWFRNWINDLFGDSSGTISKVIEYGLMILALSVFIYYMIKIKDPTMFSKSAIKRRKIKISELDEVEEKDLQDLLAEAIAANDYEQVMRLRFLLVLKQMEEHRLIEWQSYKTNLDYLFELPSGEIKKRFERLIDWFEYSWYGNFDFDQKLFQLAMDEFDDFLKLIKTPAT